MTSTIFPPSNKFLSDSGGLSPLWSDLFRYINKITGGLLSETFLTGSSLTTSNPTFEIDSVGDVYIAGVKFPKTYIEGKVLYVESTTEFAYGDTSTIPGFFITGETAFTVKTTADVGWIMLNGGTIGSASSGATTRANADTQDLFELLWTVCPNTYCPVSGGRGLTAAADFILNKTLTLPNNLGRVYAGQGVGSGLTARLIGETTGTETHTLITSEMPSHTHPSYTKTTTSSTAYRENLGGGGSISYTGFAGSTSTSQGGGGSHSNVQPSIFLNTQIKL
jgi:hypothetical protein